MPQRGVNLSDLAWRFVKAQAAARGISIPAYLEWLIQREIDVYRKPKAKAP